MSFRRVQLEDVADEITVGYVSSMVSEYQEDGIPFLRSLNIQPYQISTSDLKYISSAFHERLKKSALAPGDVVVVRTGKPGTCAVIPEWLKVANCSDLVIIRCGENLNPRYLCYWTNSLASHHITSSIVGAVQQHFNVGAARKMPLLLPSFTEQERIVALLGSLDDKIELNQRMNETLESMAQAIFRDWFVDFGPTRRQFAGATDPIQIMGGLTPNPEKAAALGLLFPPTLADNGLPEGWTGGVLGDLARQVGEVVNPGDIDPTTPYIGLEHMPRRSIALSEWEAASKITSNKSRFRRGDILFGKLRPYFHKVGIAPVDGVCSTDIVVLQAKAPVARALAATCVSGSDFVAFTDQTSTGTKMPRTSWKIMKTYPLPIAGASVIEEFARIVDPTIEKVAANIHENRTLAAMRDLLLPKLMSGEIRLRDAVRAVGEAAA